WLTPWRGLLTPMAPRPAAGRDTTPAAEVVRVPVDSASVRPPPAPGAARAPAQRPPARIPALPQAPPARGAAPESVSRNPAAERAARIRPEAGTVRPTPSELPVRPPAAQPPSDPREEIKAVIADYGRALESRDLSDVRRAYPGLTSAEQETFRQFFQSVRELK